MEQAVAKRKAVKNKPDVGASLVRHLVALTYAVKRIADRFDRLQVPAVIEPKVHVKTYDPMLAELKLRIESLEGHMARATMRAYLTPTRPSDSSIHSIEGEFDHPGRTLDPIWTASERARGWKNGADHG